MGKISCSAVVFAVLMSTASFAQAEGCLKGAAVGGAVGHLKHHAVIGAITGCAVGHHMAAAAAKKEKEAKAAQG